MFGTCVCDLNVLWTIIFEKDLLSYICGAESNSSAAVVNTEICDWLKNIENCSLVKLMDYSGLVILHEWLFANLCPLQLRKKEMVSQV